MSGGVVRDGVVQYAGIDCWRSTSGIDYVYGDNFNYSAEHEFARKMAMATTIMGATSFGVYFLASCIRFPPALWLLISITLVATCICEGLIFKFFDTEWCENTDCELSTSSRCGISACVFWGLSSVMTGGVFKQAMDRRQNSQDEE